MTIGTVRRCACGAMLLPGSPALVCSFECMAREFGGSLPPRGVLHTPPVSESTKAKMAAKAQEQMSGYSAIVPPLARVTDFPSKHVEIVRHWEARNEGVIDPATLPDEDDSAAWPQAVSKAQVYWARNQLRKAQNGAPVPQSIAELEALANTPLAGLPERKGQKAPVKPKSKPTTKKVKGA
jgi:hypothetical protein